MRPSLCTAKFTDLIVGMADALGRDMQEAGDAVGGGSGGRGKFFAAADAIVRAQRQPADKVFGGARGPH